MRSLRMASGVGSRLKDQGPRRETAGRRSSGGRPLQYNRNSVVFSFFIWRLASMSCCKCLVGGDLRRRHAEIGKVLLVVLREAMNELRLYVFVVWWRSGCSWHCRIGA